MNFKAFFGFNKKERIGVIMLLLLLLLVISAYILLPEFLSYPRKAEDEKLREQVEAFIEARKKARQQEEARIAEAQKKKGVEKDNIRTSRKLTPFPFNPNNLAEDKWQAIGFSDKQISIIKNYEKSGGSFRKKGDLKRIYGIDEKEYQQLEPYIRIPEQKNKKPRENQEEQPEKKEKPTFYTINLNTTDSVELQKVYGIGPVFSKRIIKFREILGGFYSTSQLLEVYGIDSSKFQQVKNHFTVDPDRIQTLNINTSTFKELLAHPYLDYYLVKEITTYREKNGPYEKLEELKNIPLIYDDLYDKITPYLTIQ